MSQTSAFWRSYLTQFNNNEFLNSVRSYSIAYINKYFWIFLNTNKIAAHFLTHYFISSKTDRPFKYFYKSI